MVTFVRALGPSSFFVLGCVCLRKSFANPIESHEQPSETEGALLVATEEIQVITEQTDLVVNTHMVLLIPQVRLRSITIEGGGAWSDFCVTDLKITSGFSNAGVFSLSLSFDKAVSCDEQITSVAILLQLKISNSGSFYIRDNWKCAPTRILVSSLTEIVNSGLMAIHIRGSTSYSASRMYEVPERYDVEMEACLDIRNSGVLTFEGPLKLPILATITQCFSGNTALVNNGVIFIKHAVFVPEVPIRGSGCLSLYSNAQIVLDSQLGVDPQQTIYVNAVGRRKRLFVKRGLNDPVTRLKIEGFGSNFYIRCFEKIRLIKYDGQTMTLFDSGLRTVMTVEIGPGYQRSHFIRSGWGVTYKYMVERERPVHCESGNAWHRSEREESDDE